MIRRLKKITIIFSLYFRTNLYKAVIRMYAKMVVLVTKMSQGAEECIVRAHCSGLGPTAKSELELSKNGKIQFLSAQHIKNQSQRST